MSRIIHPIPPLYNEDSKILILGSFPSVKSREAEFFYGHPQNRFWKVLSGIFGEAEPKSIEEKKLFLLKNGIALWDVIAECEIVGSSDSSITDEKVNDISPILKAANINAIFTNGKKSHTLFEQKMKPLIGRSAIYLPSTSPANAVFSVEKLMQHWKIIKEYTEVNV